MYEIYRSTNSTYVSAVEELFYPGTRIREPVIVRPEVEFCCDLVEEIKVLDDTGRHFCVLSVVEAGACEGGKRLLL